MMRHFHGCVIALAIGCFSTVQAADYRVEALGEAAPSDVLSAEIANLLSPVGVRVLRGEATKFCDIWLCKEIALKAGFEETPEITYPLAPGQLVGAIRFTRRGADFRDQRINRGVYTLRYAHQPVDGSHVGTSLTRDFLLLVNAERDQSSSPLEYDGLTEGSSEAAGTGHPCLLSLQRLSSEQDKLSMRHDEHHDWWIVHVQTHSAQKQDFALEVVVVGLGEE